MPHVTYDDIMNVRVYLDYPYSKDGFDIDRDIYNYSDNKETMNNYLDSYCTSEYLEKKLYPKLQEYSSLGIHDGKKFATLFGKDNPSVMLAIYSGVTINGNKVFQDMDKTDDVKKILIELTGELNAAAFDGIFSLYADVLSEIENARNTPKLGIIKDYYQKLKTCAYVFMKKGQATDFFYMPLADIRKARDNKDVDALLDSLDRFVDVYIRNHSMYSDCDECK